MVNRAHRVHEEQLGRSAVFEHLTCKSAQDPNGRVRSFFPERPLLALSSPTETDGEGQQTVAYEPLAEPTINDRYLRI